MKNILGIKNSRTKAYLAGLFGALIGLFILHRTDSNYLFYILLPLLLIWLVVFLFCLVKGKI